MAQTLRLFALFFCLWSIASVVRAEPRVFALVVTSNRGTSIAQPPLAYADDDGVRYFQLFRAAAKSPDDVQLLTTFDAATRAAYAHMEASARPPARAELTTAIGELAAKVQAAHSRGEETAFYFVFAGHGEVHEGRGYLGLEDSAIDGDFIEHALIERIPADTKHIVLDSCNSFFVVNPRKPGGRRWATPDDMAFGFSARHPEVGVFLSTNAEEEVYEWSKLESGVFSHEVRSGLRGGADVDRNGRVSYSELAGFVTRANEGITRESLRPHLFYRGPEGKRDATLFSMSSLRGARLALDSAQTKAWISDARGERVLDLHKETGPLTVVVPTEQGELSLYAQAPELSSVAKAYRLQMSEGALALREETPELASRGQRMFGELFSAPYGPLAQRDFRKSDETASSQVFGLTESDTIRARYYLREISQSSRLTRARNASLFTALTASSAMATIFEATRTQPRVRVIAPLGVVDAALLSSALYFFIAKSPSEGAFQSLRSELARGPVAGKKAFTQIGSQLREWERQLRRRRILGAALPMALAAIAIGGTLFLWPTDKDGDLEIDRYHGRVVIPTALATTLGFIAIGAWQIATPSTEERLIRMYRSDPQLSLQLSANVNRNGGGLGLRAAF